MIPGPVIFRQSLTVNDSGKRCLAPSHAARGVGVSAVWFWGGFQASGRLCGRMKILVSVGTGFA